MEAVKHLILFSEPTEAVFAVPRKCFRMRVVGRITGQNNPFSVGGHERECLGVGKLCFGMYFDFVLVRDGKDSSIEGPVHRLG